MGERSSEMGARRMVSMGIRRESERGSERGSEWEVSVYSVSGLPNRLRTRAHQS